MQQSGPEKSSATPAAQSGAATPTGQPAPAAQQPAAASAGGTSAAFRAQLAQQIAAGPSTPKPNANADAIKDQLEALLCKHLRDPSQQLLNADAPTPFTLQVQNPDSATPSVTITFSQRTLSVKNPDLLERGDPTAPETQPENALLASIQKFLERKGYYCQRTDTPLPPAGSNGAARFVAQGGTITVYVRLQQNGVSPQNLQLNILTPKEVEKAGVLQQQAPSPAGAASSSKVTIQNDSDYVREIFNAAQDPNWNDKGWGLLWNSVPDTIHQLREYPENNPDYNPGKDTQVDERFAARTYSYLKKRQAHPGFWTNLFNLRDPATTAFQTEWQRKYEELHPDVLKTPPTPGRSSE